MDNSTYALQFAAGVIIAVMIIAIVIYVFNVLSEYQSSQDSIAERESISEFNESFEVYDKSLMYGYDVLSCLNKAQDNNQKYVYSIYYGSDASTITWDTRSKYIVNVYVTINSRLEETITVYKKNVSGSIVQSTEEYNFKPFSNSTGFDLPEVEYYYFTTVGSQEYKVYKNEASYDELMWDGVSGALSLSSTLKAGTYYTAMGSDTGAATYKLVVDKTDGEDVLTDAGRLLALLSTATSTEQTIYKTNYVEASQGWYSATWALAINDFKTRKFECTGIEYDETTGYVTSISFVEKDS